MTRFPSEDTNCARARAWASLELDGELSEVEQVLLADHLDVCPACEAVRERLHAVTATLREAALERPVRAPRLPPARRPSPRRRIATLRLAVAVVLAAGAAGLGVMTTLVGQEKSRAVPPPEPEIALLPTGDQLRELRRASDPDRPTQPQEPLSPLPPRGRA